MINAKQLKECTKNLTVLYVEDDDRLREDTTKLLNNFYSEVHTATNGLEGIEKYTKGSYDLIITDLNMPVMGGLEMSREIKSYNFEQAIIITSAYDESKYLIDLINIGVDTFILKPLDLQMFLAALYRVCKGISDAKELERFYDILEQKVVEETEKRRQSEQMLIQKGRLAAMGELMQAIAHQWKQPLNGLGLILQDLAEAYEYGEVNESFIKDMVENGMAQINFLSKTIDDFRSFLMPGRKKVPFNLHDAIVNTLSLVGVNFSSQNIAITINGDKTIQGIGYPNEFKQVILNVLHNALDTMEERDTKDRCIEVSLFSKDTYAVTTITDNAGGISSDIIDKIFAPYFTTKNEEKGTGIGLYMSKTIIEKNMGGRLFANNTGNGAMFTIELQQST
ncbi:MAG: response regulator [Nitrospirae bacterium]|nr:response regulator [Nitrospirota bacterium]